MENTRQKTKKKCLYDVMGCCQSILLPNTGDKKVKECQEIYKITSGNFHQNQDKKTADVKKELSPQSSLQNLNTSKKFQHANLTVSSTPDNESVKRAKIKVKFDQRVTAKYDIKALIGKGSFSRVVRVEQRLTKQPYAIKMIDRQRGKDVFESELNVLRRVSHQYIIQLIEVFESTSKVYMVMELATGGELFDRIIAKGSFTEIDATTVLCMVLNGLRYLHSLGITHRDLKPENLLYYHPGHDSKILITDFGLSSTRKGADDFMKTTCGTPEYIAPEVLAKTPYTSQVDVWAVGVIAYILLSGSIPFDDDNKARLYRTILKAKYSYKNEHWKDVSEEAKNFIDSLLVVDPQKRLTASQAMKHSWIMSKASTSSKKNLHRTISQNLLRRQSTRSSLVSRQSAKSLRSEHRHVLPEDIDALHRDPQVRAEIRSLSSRTNTPAKSPTSPSNVECAC